MLQNNARKTNGKQESYCNLNEMLEITHFQTRLDMRKIKETTVKYSLKD